MKRIPGRLSFFFFLLLILSTAVPAGILSAHVDADSMPDSEAEVEYRIFLDLRPNDAMIRNKLGMILYRRNKLQEATREFSRVLKREPNNFDALDAMGLVMSAQQQYDQAIRYHKAALAINAKDALAWYHLGGALEKKGARGAAAEAYRTALARLEAPRSPGTANGHAAPLREKIKAAIAALQKSPLRNEVAQ